MKPNKKKAREMLFNELMKKTKSKEQEILELHKNMFKLASGDFDDKIEIESSSNGDSWYINIPCIVWTFIKK